LPHSWKNVVNQAINQYGSITKVAELLNVSRTTLSLALRGKYPAGTENLETKVFETFGEGVGPVECPHLGAEIGTRECRTYRERPAPMSHAAELRHWQACKSCPVPGTPPEE
jgi:hypothetical protein